MEYFAAGDGLGFWDFLTLCSEKPNNHEDEIKTQS
jgi:hypothetical protein